MIMTLAKELIMLDLEQLTQLLGLLLLYCSVIFFVIKRVENLSKELLKWLF